MPETLFDRLRRLRQRVVQLVSLYGASWIVAVVFSAVLVAGFLDWLVHLDDPGVRLILGLSILGLGGWVAWRRLVTPLRESLSDVDLALRVERRYPGFRDSLASTVQFLQSEHDPRLGSPDLQKRVVADTLRRVEQIDLRDVIETRPVARMAGLAALVCLVVATVAATNQAAAATALARLMFPFTAGDWPRAVELRLISASFEPVQHDPKDPIRVARGARVELFVENARGAIPDDIFLLLGPIDGEPVKERLQRATLRDDAGRTHDVAAISFEATKGPLRFRAVGGDDFTMPFYRVEVVPPPLVTELTVSLTPPRYTGRAAEALPPGVGHLQGLVGTRVALRATVNKPLKSARLRVKDRPAVALQLDSGGRELRGSFEIVEAGVYSYWFDLRDVQGFENPDAPRYEIRAIADLAPDVSIEVPATDLNVTADAEVPFRVQARDDLGLRSMRLVQRLGDGAGAQTYTVPLTLPGERPQHATAEHLLKVSDLRSPPKGLPVFLDEKDPRRNERVRPQPGDRILVHGEATDDFDLGPEHVGRSISRVLTVVSAEEKAGELAARQSSLVDELERVVTSQTRAREQVNQLLLQMEKAKALQPADLDLLKRIELDQKQIASRLADPAGGMEGRARELAAELKQNRIDDPAMTARLEQLADDLGLLKEEHLPEIERNLTQARKAAAAEGRDADERRPEETPQNLKSQDLQSETPDPQRPASSSERADDKAAALRRAGRNQEAVLQTLGEQLKKLAEWRSRRDVTEEAGELISGQKGLNDETAELGRRTVGKSEGELTPQEQADLARLADRQARHGERLSQFRSKLVDLANGLEESNPQSAQALRDAQEGLRRQATAERMRDIAGQIEKNNVGQAATGQQQVLDELSELQNALKEKPADDAEQLVKKLQTAADELDALRKKEETLRKRIDAAMENPNDAERRDELARLKREQEALRNEAQEMARRLRRLQNRPAADAARRAADRMQNAEDALERDAGDQAAESLDEALDDLEQAQRELAKQRREAEEELAQELLERIADEIAGMIARQQGVIDETLRLDAAFQERGSWTRGQLRSLVSLAETQRNLKAETDRLVEQVKAAEVFALALKGASQRMETAATRLSERKTDAATVDAEKGALKRFQDLTASLQPETSKPEANGQKPEGDAGGNEPAGPPSDGIPHLAQLKMLKTLQEDLLGRTSALDAARAKTGALTPEQMVEADSIALEQGQLADLARNLVQRVTEMLSPEGGQEE